MSKANIENIADILLQNLRDRLGEEVYSVIMKRVVKDYLGNNTDDLRSAMIQRPEIFESALVDLLGQVGRILLAKACEDIKIENGLFYYSKPGDLAKCMALVSKT
ncbi:MAG TPA: hypothetical protein VHD33_00910 [Legionellaceae bacterium]|nr:hypothetical protein [Legionellaceae bacterium]